MRDTVDGRRCLNRSDRGDCGSHSAPVAAVDVADAPVWPVATLNPFGGAAAWRHREEYEAKADTTVRWNDTVVARAEDDARTWLDRARKVCADDPDLLEVLADAQPPQRPHAEDHPGLPEARLAEAQEHWDAVHGDPEPAWTQIRRLVGDNEGQVHIADACEKVDAADGVWGPCADFADRSFCGCVSGFVPRLADLRERFRASQRQIGTARTAIRISRIERFDAGTAAELIPHLTPPHGGGVGQWRPAIRRRAQATVDADTAAWLLRLASSLDRSVDLHDHDTTSRLAESLRDAVVIDGVADPDELAGRAAADVDGLFTRRSRLRTQAAELVDGAAAWASGTEEASRKDSTGPFLPGRHTRVSMRQAWSRITDRPEAGIQTSDPRHAMLFVLAEAATPDDGPDPISRRRKPPAVKIAHGLADSIASTRHRIRDMRRRVYATSRW